MEQKKPKPLNEGLFYFINYYLYILKTTITDKYYTGITDKPDRRLHFENTIEKGYTVRYRPRERLYPKECSDKEVLRIHLQIKAGKAR